MHDTVRYGDRMSSARLASSILIPLVVIGALTACTPSAPTNLLSEGWANDQAVARGSAGGVLMLAPDEPIVTPTAQLILGLDPFDFTEFEAGCSHGGPVRLLVAGLGDADLIRISVGVDVECDDVMHTYAMPDGGATGVAKVSFDAESEAPVSLAVSVPVE